MRFRDRMSNGVSRRRGMLSVGGFRLASTMFVVIGFALIFSGCGKVSPTAPTPPPPAVTVAKPLQQDVIEWDTYNGYLEAKESVNVSARVSGMIVAAPFEEGTLVKKSQVLFVLDERPFKADLDLKLAEFEKAKAQVVIAQLNFQRMEDARKHNVVSQQDYDSAKAECDKALAALGGAKASVETSRLNLDWCQVTSPSDGRVSRKIVTVGNLITSGGGAAPPTLLTTIQSVSPIYCNIDVDEQSIQKYQRLAAEKKRVHERDGRVPCFVRLGSEVTFRHAGFIDFVDNRLDMSTGTQRMRALLPNDSGTLTPGFYASLRIPGSGRYKALLVPDAAIGSDQSHRTVLVINQANIVEVRTVEVGALFGDLRAITSGLSPDEKVIVNGQMKAFPGTPVTPTESTLQLNSSSIADSGTASLLERIPTAGVSPTSGKTP
jgi:membrane fusion protein, multidrug efflux system